MKPLIFVSMIVIIVCTLLISTTGCEPEGNTTVRQERLYSAENMELKKRIAQLEKRYEKDMSAKEEALQECLDKNETLSKQVGSDAVKMFENEVMTSLMEQVKQLTDENQQLKERIKQLEKQINEVRVLPLSGQKTKPETTIKEAENHPSE